MELSQILSFPYIWSPKKIIRFLKEAHSYLNPPANTRSDIPDVINTEANDWGVLEYQDESENWNWSRGFSLAQLSVLTRFYTSNNRQWDMTYRFDCLTDLVKVIRHKHEHYKDLPDHAKECLFGNIPEEHLFDHAYVSFWIAKFPCLVTFLWISLTKFVGNQLDQCFSVKWPKEIKFECPDLNCYLYQLNEAVAEAKSEGLLQARYTVCGKILEFYQLSTNAVHKILSAECSSVILHVYQDHINFFWSDYVKRLQYREYIPEKSLKYGALPGSSLAVLAEVYLDHLCSIVTNCKSNRIMYFTANVSNLAEMIRETSQSLDIDIQELPIQLHEFNIDIKRKIYNSEISIGEVEKRVKLRTFLNFEDINKMVTGNNLTSLLRGNTVRFFQNYSLPKASPCFIRRTLVLSHVQFPPDVLHLRKCMIYKGEMTHTKLRKLVNQNSNPGQVVCIANKCGMGKSEVIKKIANEIFQKYKSKFVLFYSMRKFLEIMSKSSSLEHVKISDIISFVNSQISQTDLERIIVQKWFSNEKRRQIRLELFFDGLDEVSEELQDSSLSLITLIRNVCPSVRIWIACRDHMVVDIENRFQIQAYKLTPLQFSESVTLTHKYCLINLNLNYTENEQKENNVKEVCWLFSCDCTIELDCQKSDVSMIPLHCAMLADFVMSTFIRKYIKNELTKNLFQELKSKNSWLHIFEHMVQKKFEYFLEKFNLDPGSVSSVGTHYKKLQLNDMIRSSTLLSLEYVFGKVTKAALTPQLITDSLVKKVVLDQGFVQSFDDLVFCHRSICEFIVVDFIFKIYTKGSYLGVCGNDTKFQTLLWEEMLKVKFNKDNNSPKVIFKYDQLCKVFSWFCKKHCDEVGQVRSGIKWFPAYYEWVKLSRHRLLYFHFLTQQKITISDSSFCSSFDHRHFTTWIYKLDVMEQECNKMLATVNSLSSEERAKQFKKWIMDTIVKVAEDQDIYSNLFVVSVLMNLALVMKRIAQEVLPDEDYYDKWVEGNYKESLKQMFSNDNVQQLLEHGMFKCFEHIAFYEPLIYDDKENVEQGEEFSNNEKGAKDPYQLCKSWLRTFPFSYYHLMKKGKGPSLRDIYNDMAKNDVFYVDFGDRFSCFEHSVKNEGNERKRVSWSCDMSLMEWVTLNGLHKSKLFTQIGIMQKSGCVKRI